MNNFKINIKNISPVTLKLIYYGTILSLGILLIGIFGYAYNMKFIESYANIIYFIKIIMSAFSLFVQFIIGGIIFDCVFRQKK